MATNNETPAPGANGEGEEEEGRTRLPRVVVRMSDAMKAALDAFCTSNSVVATQLGRELIAAHIGFDLQSDPDAPGGATRTKYTDEEAREAGKKANRLRNGLLRRALFQAHQGQIKNRPILLATAQATVMALADSAKRPTLAQLEELQATLEAAVEAAV